MYVQIAKLQESQAELLERCTTMDGACQRLHRELDQMRSRWENGKVENLRLKTEVEHLRRNMRVGEHQDLVRLSLSSLWCMIRRPILSLKSALLESKP